MKYQKYQVGCFDEEMEANFQLWREFDTEDEARDFVWRHYWEGQKDEMSDNVIILYRRRIIFDGRWVRLN